MPIKRPEHHPQTSEDGGVSLLRGWIKKSSAHVNEAYFLFPLLGAVLLVSIWLGTSYFIKVERTRAEDDVAATTLAMSVTYESQILRSIREIDQTLKIVKYNYEVIGDRDPLPKLKKRSLLPPALLFDVSIVDSKGLVTASTKSQELGSVLSAQKDIGHLQSEDMLWVGRPWKSEETGEWRLGFSRGLRAANGDLAGFVIVEVDAAYFISSYEASAMGDKGVLAVVGSDGFFRVRRTGQDIAAGDAIDLGALAPDAENPNVILESNSWDSVQRYTSVRKLYDFPLVVVVGLSREEQLAPVISQFRTYGWQTAGASLLVVLLFGLLGRVSWQLAQSRARAAAAKIAHSQRVEYLAYHDGLTTLPNRSLFSKLLEQCIAEASRDERQVAVLFLDLDRFKQINDTLGHDAGDMLLQEVARRLKSCLMAGDSVARLGGDEFVVLLPGLADGERAAAVAQKILSAVASPYDLQGREFRITVSIGISVYPQDGLDEQTLKRNSDVAMYQAKQRGKNNFQFYSGKLNEESFERLTLEMTLRQALEKDEFNLHYQAKRDTRTGLITGMEVLLRWEHPELGLLLPMQFMPVAEETGLIVAIGRWVIRTACKQNKVWQQQGLPDLRVAINLSERQFLDESLLDDLDFILKETKMNPALLELEITEHLLRHDMKKTLKVLAGFKALGVKVAIDDFGVGYSTLHALEQFSINSIKIDRSFVCDASSVGEEQALARAIVKVGKTLCLTVVAQGIETKEQADFMRDNACDEFQGFYFNKPVAANQFGALLIAQCQAEA
jgi:diguanylate cyclase (GGDEF)-like protein